MRKKLYLELTSPDGKNYTTEDLDLFCIENDLDIPSMRNIHRGIIDSHRGWREGHDRGVYTQTKISLDAIEKMKKLSNTCSYQQIAARFGVTQATVRRYLKCY